MTSLSSWLSPSSVRHGCPPYPARVLLPYDILPLPRDVLLIPPRFLQPVSGGLCMEVPLPCMRCSDSSYRAAAPCGCPLLPAWALTSNAGQRPCVGTCVTQALCRLAPYSMDTLLVSLGVCLPTSGPLLCGYHSSPALDRCGCCSPSVVVYLGFRLKQLIRKRGREKGILIS